MALKYIGVSLDARESYDILKARLIGCESVIGLETFRHHNWWVIGYPFNYETKRVVAEFLDEKRCNWKMWGGDPRKEGALTAPYVKGSDTSKAAAESIEGDLARLESIVLQEIARRGDNGATDDEIEKATELAHQTASARRRGLVQKGLVVATRKRRATRSGRKATVWVTAQVAKGMTGLIPKPGSKRPTRKQATKALEELRTLYKSIGKTPGADVVKLLQWARVNLAKQELKEPGEQLSLPEGAE